MSGKPAWITFHFGDERSISWFDLMEDVTTKKNVLKWRVSAALSCFFCQRAIERDSRTTIDAITFEFSHRANLCEVWEYVAANLQRCWAKLDKSSAITRRIYSGRVGSLYSAVRVRYYFIQCKHIFSVKKSALSDSTADINPLLHFPSD